MNQLKKIVVITSLATIASCGGTNVKKAVIDPLPLPPPIPAHMLLNIEELSCLSNATFDKIIYLDKRIYTLEGIIKSTHKD